MNKTFPSCLVALTVVCLGWSSTSEATLLSRLGGAAVYDTDLDITWLADPNYGLRNPFGLPLSPAPGGISNVGTTNFANANAWIAEMNSAHHLGYSDWRLPTSLQPDPSCDASGLFGDIGHCSGGELGHLYYDELGGTVSSTNLTILSSGDPDLALFNLDFPTEVSHFWTSTPAPGGYIYIFGFGLGNRTVNGPNGGSGTWAVRDGDVVAAIGEPESLLLAGAAFGIPFGRKRRRRTR